jgi:protein gp37
MGRETGIAWCDHTFNPWMGCTPVGPECDHCYAQSATPVRVFGVTWGAHTARRITGPGTWSAPLSWHRAARRDGVRRRVFCASLADVFEDRRDLDVPRAWLWALIAATPGLDWLLLTKRPAKVLRLVPIAWHTAWPAHVWIGTSIGCRASVPQLAHLRGIPARVRFLSCEPLLDTLPVLDLRGIHWVIGGGESGPGFRLLDPSAARNLRDQVKAAALPFFFKQYGGVTAKAGGKMLDGREWCEFPEEVSDDNASQ